jgi:hypothetical protein
MDKKIIKAQKQRYLCSHLARSSVLFSLGYLQLTARLLGIANNQAQHTFGLDSPALSHKQTPLLFFTLLPSLRVEHPT